jgi:capsular polysaccharide biosynthesis protein
VAALEWIESGLVRTPADVERKLGLAVLGAIPSAER